MKSVNGYVALETGLGMPRLAQTKPHDTAITSLIRTAHKHYPASLQNSLNN